MRLRSRSRSLSARAALRSRSFTYLSRYGSRLFAIAQLLRLFHHSEFHELHVPVEFFPLVPNEITYVLAMRVGHRLREFLPTTKVHLRPTSPLAAPVPRRHRNRHVVDWLLRREPQVLHIFRGIVFDRFDPFLIRHFARHRRGTRVTHQAVAETLAYVEEKVVAFLFRVLRFFLRT